jgi:carboxypeptidase C (cathepsin A)
MCHLANAAPASSSAADLIVWHFVVHVKVASHVLHVPIASLLMGGSVHAGHMIPIDQPRSALRMVRMIMDRHRKISGGQQPARPSDIVDSTF